MSKCLGFGEFERKCENEAGSAWGPYWCQRCDELRMNHISARFDEIEERRVRPQTVTGGGGYKPPIPAPVALSFGRER